MAGVASPAQFAKVHFWRTRVLRLNLTWKTLGKKVS